MTNPETTDRVRLLAIGDIHGCLDRLEALLTMVAPSAQDRLVFLGDYIDRGPESAGVITRLIDLGRELPATVFLRGNHEQMFLDYLAGREQVSFLLNGGMQTLDSYRESGQWPIPPEHRDFLDSLVDYHEEGGCIFVHAGLRPGRPLNEQDPLDLRWIRRDFMDSDYDWGRTVVYGHTPQEEPLLGDKRLGLDTGCVYGRRLTCCDVLTRQIWQA